MGGPTLPILAAVLFLPPGLGELPPLADANRFPPQAVTKAQIRSLIQRRYFLGTSPELEPHRRGHRQALLDDNTWRLEMWELLPEAQGGLLEDEDDTGTDADRRRRLARLRDRAGWREYYARRMPRPSFV